MKSGMWVALAALCAALGGGGNGAAAEDAKLTTAKLDWRSKVLSGTKANEVQITAGTPEGLKAPADDGELKFGRILGRTWVCVDYSEKARLWVDLDMDGELTDERVIAIKPTGQKWSLERTILLPVEGRALPFPLDVRLYQTAGCKPTHVHFVPQAHLAGLVELAGRLRQIAVTDGNADLKFDGAADKVYVDVDGDGQLTITGNSIDLVPLDTPVRIGPSTFTIKLIAGPGGIATALEFHLAGAEAAAPATAPAKAPSTGPAKQPGTSPGADTTKWRGPTLAEPGRTAEAPPITFAELRQRINQERPQTPAQRRPALQLLGRLGTAEAFGALEQIVRNEDENYLVRGYAAEEMGYTQYLPFAARVRALIETKQMSSVSNGIMAALHYMDDPGRERFYIEHLTGSSMSYVVGAAAKYLAVIDSDAARKAVIDAARERQPTMLRYQAYLGARYLPGGIPLDVVKAAALEKTYPMLQANGMRDYLQLDPDGARAMAHKLVGEKLILTLALAIVDVLGPNAGPAEVRSLLLLGIGAEGQVTERVLAVLKPIRGAAATAELLRGLKAPQPGVRTIAALVLAEIANRDTTDALMKAAKREADAGTLAAICEALGRHADPRAVDLLIKIGRGNDPDRRNAAIRALAAIGPGNPKVSKFMLKLLTSKRWEDRVFALDAAAANPEKSLAKKVIDNLTHKVWQVRLAACQALGKIRVKEAVEPLIERLEDDKSRAVIGAAAEALFLTTGENFYDIAKIWRQWWKDNKAKFTVPKAIPQRPKGHSQGSAATFYGLPLNSDRLCFVIDQSGSMSAADAAADDGRTRFEVAIEEVIGAVGRLRPQDWVNVVLFETGVEAWQPQLKQVGPNKSALTKFLKKQGPRGGTNLWDGLEMALNMKHIDTIFLLSDGAPGAGKFTAPADILREAKKINQLRRITIHCISIGTESQLLKDLAAQNSGKYVRR